MKTKICLLLMVVIWTVSYSSAQDAKSVSIALIADKAGSLDKSPLMSLLEAQLSQNGNIKLLERAQIDKILQEQQLSAAGLLNRTNSIKIGQLLRADALVIITAEPSAQPATPTANASTGTLIRVRVVQTSHGLRLLDCFEQLDQSRLNDVAQTISKRVTAVTKKLLLPAGKAIPVGIVDIHRVQLGEQYRILERTLPKLLSVRLGIEPKIIMLEREDLKILQDEILRTQGEDSKFWASAVLIEGNLQPKNGSLEMQLTLARPAGKDTKIITVPVEPNEPSLAVDKASIDIVRQILNAPPSTQWQLAAEAEQFYQQGQMLAVHRRIEDAINLFDSAHALQPQNVYYSKSLFERLFEIRRDIENVVLNNESRLKAAEEYKKSNPRATVRPPTLVEPDVCPYSDMEIADLVSVLVRQISDGYEKGQISGSDLSNFMWSRYIGPAGALDSTSYFSNSISVATEQVRILNRENRKIWIRTMDEVLRRQSMAGSNPQVNIPFKRAELAWISTDVPEELITNLKNAFTELIMPPALGGKIESDSVRSSNFKGLLNMGGGPIGSQAMAYPIMLERTQLRGASEKFIELWREYLQELTRVDDQLVSSESKLALLHTPPNSSNRIAQTQTESNVYKEIELLIEKLKSPEKNQSIQTKQQILSQIKNFVASTGTGLSSNEAITLWEEMCNLLIEQKDIDSLAYLNPGSRSIIRLGPPSNRDNQSLYLQYYLLLDRIAEMLQNRKNDKQILTALNNIKDYQASIKTQFPDLNIPKSSSNLTATMLLNKQDWIIDTEDIVREYELSSPGKPFVPDFKFVVNALQIKLQDEIFWMTMLSGGSGVSRDSQGNRFYPFTVGLAGISLSQKKLVALWQAKIVSSNGVHLISDLSIGKNACYISIPNAGIVAFPGSTIKGREFFRDPNNKNIKNIPLVYIRGLGKEIDLKRNKIQITDLSPEDLEEISRKKNEEVSRDKYLKLKSFKKPVLYTQNNGLPSLLITCIAQDGDKLWVAYGDRNQESGFGLYEPSTEKWETIYCSTLKGESPFSQGQPYQINSMLLESPDKLLFSAGGNGFTRAGLWKLNTDNKQLQYIWSGVTDIYKDINSNIWLNSSTYKMKFDSDSEKITVLMRPGRKQMYAYVIKDTSGLEKELFVPESFLNNVNFGPYYALGNLDLSTGTIHNNKLWARLGTSQIIIAEKGKSYEDAKIIDNNLLDGQPVERFVSTPYGLIGIGAGIVGLIETGD
jgi:hypothetical protein